MRWDSVLMLYKALQQCPTKDASTVVTDGSNAPVVTDYRNAATADHEILSC